MTEMQAAIGRRQLAKLPAWLAARRRNARARSTRELAGTPGLVVPAARRVAATPIYKFYAFVDPGAPRAGLDAASASSRRSTPKAYPAAEGSCSEMYLEKAFVGTGLVPAAPPAGRARARRDEPHVHGPSDA